LRIGRYGYARPPRTLQHNPSALPQPYEYSAEITATETGCRRWPTETIRLSSYATGSKDRAGYIGELAQKVRRRPLHRPRLSLQIIC
jgi:hypothetical protein